MAAWRVREQNRQHTYDKAEAVAAMAEAAGVQVTVSVSADYEVTVTVKAADFVQLVGSVIETDFVSLIELIKSDAPVIESINEGLRGKNEFPIIDPSDPSDPSTPSHLPAGYEWFYDDDGNPVSFGLTH